MRRLLTEAWSNSRRYRTCRPCGFSIHKSVMRRLRRSRRRCPPAGSAASNMNRPAAIDGRRGSFHSKLHQVGNQFVGGPGLPTQPIPSTVYGISGAAACAISRIADSKRHTVDLYLVRHAQSRNNAQPVELRVEDPALTDLGHEQARRLAERVTRLRLTKLFTSPFRRALQTAEHVRLATGLIPEVRIDLHEKGGCVSGVAPPVTPWASRHDPR